MALRSYRTGSTSEVDDCKVPTLKARLTMALIKMELLERKASLGKDNSVYLMYIKWMNV